jgi:hypothetical protein
VIRILAVLLAVLAGLFVAAAALWNWAMCEMADLDAANGDQP